MKSVRLRRMSAEVPATSGYFRSAGEGEGDNGEIILAPLLTFRYLRTPKKLTFNQQYNEEKDKT